MDALARALAPATPNFIYTQKFNMQLGARAKLLFFFSRRERALAKFIPQQTQTKQRGVASAPQVHLIVAVSQLTAFERSRQNTSTISVQCFYFLHAQIVCKSSIISRNFSRFSSNQLLVLACFQKNNVKFYKYISF